MKRVVVLSALLGIVLAGGTVSGAASPTTGLRAHSQSGDRFCVSLTRARNAHSYPPDRRWVWAIANGCVYTRDLPRPQGCTADPETGCLAPPDVHVRVQRREYVFHLTLRGVPAGAKGLWNAAGKRFLVTHDGRGRKTRQRLFIEFSGVEFDGILQSGPSQGAADIGPELRWTIMYTLDKKKGLCCPRVDPGSPTVSPFDVAPQRLRIAAG